MTVRNGFFLSNGYEIEIDVTRCMKCTTCKRRACISNRSLTHVTEDGTGMLKNHGSYKLQVIRTVMNMIIP